MGATMSATMRANEREGCNLWSQGREQERQGREDASKSAKDASKKRPYVPRAPMCSKDATMSAKDAGKTRR